MFIVVWILNRTILIGTPFLVRFMLFVALVHGKAFSEEKIADLACRRVFALELLRSVSGLEFKSETEMGV